MGEWLASVRRVLGYALSLDPEAAARLPTQPPVAAALGILAIAVASAAADENYFCRVVALGEVGLAGDLRRVPGLERRIGEAARLGFELAIVPAGSRDPNSKMPKMHGLRLVEVATVAEALAALGLNRNQKPASPH